MNASVKGQLVPPQVPVQRLRQQVDEVEAELLLAIHAALQPHEQGSVSAKRALRTLRQDLGMRRRDFSERVALAKFYCGELQLEKPELLELGFRRLALARATIDDAIVQAGVAAAARLLLHIRSLPVSELESRFTLKSLLANAIEGSLPPLPSVRPAPTAPPAAEPTETADDLRQVLSTVAGQVLLGRPNRFPPCPTGFVVQRSVWRNLTLAAQLESNALLVGPAGCGKTELVGRLADGTERPLFRFSFGAMSEPRLSLIGSMHYSAESGTWFNPSRFVGAIRTPKAIVLLDELNRCDNDAMNLLIPLLDGQRILSLDECENSPQVEVAPGVSFVATANIGPEFTGTNSLDHAIRDRFACVIDMDYPAMSDEIGLLMSRHRGISEPHARWLVKIAKRQREMAADGEFAFTVSTRMLLEAACKISYGITPKEAVTFSITNHFSKQGGTHSDRTRFRQLLQCFALED